MLGFHDQTELEAFWTDAAVRNATVQFKNERKEQAQNAGGAGVATPREKNQLHDEQEQRARVRESMEQAGKQAPNPEGQMERLAEVRQKRQQSDFPPESQAE